MGKLYDRERRLKQVCWYSNGRPTGVVWRFLEGGGCLVGEADAATGALTGDGVGFLFPDRQTALVGRFEDGVMVSAQTCFIQLVSVRNCICHLKFTQPRGPVYDFDPGDRDVICRRPLLPDPYESRHVYVRQSRIKGAAEGLFAKTDLSEGQVCCFYNGVRLRSDEIEDDKHDWELNAYKILDLLGKAEDGTEGEK